MEAMPSVCFYFQVHQPYRVKRIRAFDVGSAGDYFDHAGEDSLNNRRIFEKVARKCYIPANAALRRMIAAHPDFRASFSLSGVFLEQAEAFMPEVVRSFQDLVNTGQVEILGETYYHSLSFLYSREEFMEQVRQHRALVKRLFGVVPTTFRNTELIYHNEVAKAAESMGFTAILAEGADRILDWRSPNFVYRPQGTSSIKLLLKNYRLSDDIAFRFGSRDWEGYPLTSDTFASWVHSVSGNGDTVNLFMDYETFGEHQWEDTGIFRFLEALPQAVKRHPDWTFRTPQETAALYPAVSELDVPNYVSWADIERDLSAWRANDMQWDALGAIYELERQVAASLDPALVRDWRRLQTSDHFYYMCTKWFADGDVHKYFNPYETPYDAYLSYMNAVKDLKARIRQEGKRSEHAVPIRRTALT